MVSSDPHYKSNCFYFELTVLLELSMAIQTYIITRKVDPHAERGVL
jgi:hypothetical protein